MITIEDQELVSRKDIPPRGEYRFPRWLEKLLDRHEGWAGSNNRMFDHLRHIRKIAFVEPYGASDKEIAFLVAFCTEKNLRFAITGNSAHYPGRTFRIVIWRPQDEKDVGRLRCLSVHE
jgi:hypothetical protein